MDAQEKTKMNAYYLFYFKVNCMYSFRVEHTFLDLSMLYLGLILKPHFIWSYHLCHSNLPESSALQFIASLIRKVYCIFQSWYVSKFSVVEDLAIVTMMEWNDCLQLTVKCKVAIINSWCLKSNSFNKGKKWYRHYFGLFSIKIRATEAVVLNSSDKDGWAHYCLKRLPTLANPGMDFCLLRVTGIPKAPGLRNLI